VSTTHLSQLPVPRWISYIGRDTWDAGAEAYRCMGRRLRAQIEAILPPEWQWRTPRLATLVMMRTKQVQLTTEDLERLVRAE